MRRPYRLALALGFSMLATHAWADGRPCAEPFAGAYLGVGVGYGRQKVEVDNATINAKFSDESAGATVGGYLGYNWQRCDHVFGIETDLNYLGASPTAFDREPPGPSGLPETTSLESRMDWFGTLRARAGFVVHEDLLFYATGGLAYSRVKQTLFDDCVGCGNSALNLGPFFQSDRDTKFGWTVGGGAEFLHDSNWRLRAEALYVDLGDNSRTYLVVVPGVGTGVAATKWNDQFWLARLGLTYAFDAPWAPPN